MNKILKTALVGATLVPVAFCFSACGESTISQKQYINVLVDGGQKLFAETYEDYSNRVLTMKVKVETKENASYTYKETATATETVTKYHANVEETEETIIVEAMGNGANSAFHIKTITEESSVEYQVSGVDNTLQRVTSSEKSIDEYFIAKRTISSETQYLIVHTYREYEDEQEATDEAINEYEIVENYQDVVETLRGQVNDAIITVFFDSAETFIAGDMGEIANYDLTKDGSNYCLDGKINALVPMGDAFMNMNVDFDSKVNSSLVGGYEADVEMGTEAIATEDYSKSEMDIEVKVTQKKVTITLPSIDGFDEVTSIAIDGLINFNI